MGLICRNYKEMTKGQSQKIYEDRCVLRRRGLKVGNNIKMDLIEHTMMM